MEKLDEIMEMYSEGNYQAALSALEVFDPGKDPAVILDRERAMGLCFFQVQRFGDAVKQWNKVLASEPNSAQNWFNLSTSSIMNHELENGEKAFEKSLELLPSDAAASESINWRYYYVRALIDVREYERAFKEIKILIKPYVQFGITDLMYLTTSFGGVVQSFHQVMKSVSLVLPHINTETASSFLDQIEEKIDDEGKNEVQNIRRDLQKNKPSIDGPAQVGRKAVNPD